MTKSEANKKVNQLFKKWLKEFKYKAGPPTEEYYQNLSEFINECRQLHNAIGLYEVITDKNALKMASICSSVRFVEPWQMLMAIQRTTGTY